MQAPTELKTVYIRIFFVELTYWAVSISMVFVNEDVLSADILIDDLTVFITNFQIVFSLVILITLDNITNVSKSHQTTNSSLLVKIRDPNSVEISTKVIDDVAVNENYLDGNNTECISSPDKGYNDEKSRDDHDPDSLLQLINIKLPRRPSLETCKIVFPLSVLYIGMLLLNNFCLKYVGVAFYFVSRSLTTVFNVIFTYFIIKEPVSRGALVCCAFIILGFVLGIDQESVIGSLSVVGVMFGVASSLFTSLFSIYTKKTLAKLDRNIWVLMLHNMINAIILCTPLMIFHGDIQALISDKIVNLRFWLLLSISGVISFFISIVTNASIKYTSPLTHNISGTAKACFQTVIAVIYTRSNKSFLWWTSNILILVASGAYSRIKQIEMERRVNKNSKMAKVADKEVVEELLPRSSPA